MTETTTGIESLDHLLEAQSEGGDDRVRAYQVFTRLACANFIADKRHGFRGMSPYGNMKYMIENILKSIDIPKIDDGDFGACIQARDRLPQFCDFLIRYIDSACDAGRLGAVRKKFSEAEILALATTADRVDGFTMIEPDSLEALGVEWLELAPEDLDRMRGPEGPRSYLPKVIAELYERSEIIPKEDKDLIMEAAKKLLKNLNHSRAKMEAVIADQRAKSNKEDRVVRNDELLISQLDMAGL